MKIVKSFPPNYQQICDIIGTPTDNAIYTYGDTLYNPGDGYVDSSLLEHEKTHTKQQGNKIQAWWHRYLHDPQFRLKQEVEAYHVQYRHYTTIVKDRNKQSTYLHKLAHDLASPLYGSLVTPSQAKHSILSNIPFK